MTWHGACPCGAVRFTVDGPVRNVIVCHCGECQSATGGPWPATAAYQRDLVVEDQDALVWDRAAVSEYGASRGRCRSCETVVFWDSPARDTVSFAAALIEGGEALAVAAHIWVAEGERASLASEGVPVERKGLPASVSVPWHAETRTTG